MARILLVEDNELMAASIEACLAGEKYQCDLAGDGVLAEEYLRNYQYDVLILDWQLPGKSGVEVCADYRKTGGKGAVLMLTGESSIERKEIGLDAGADDYLTKPFDPRELLARVRALLRRQPVYTEQNLKAGDIVLDTRSKVVIRAGVEVKLMPMEYGLLEFMMKNPLQIFTPESLLNRLWSADAQASVDSVYQCIKRVRRKLESSDGPELIQTVRGHGYRFVPPGDN